MKCADEVCLHELDSFATKKANPRNKYKFCKRCRMSPLPYVLKCFSCEELFTTGAPQKMYCSTKCRYRAAWKKNGSAYLKKRKYKPIKKHKFCVICNNPTPKWKGTYCSTKCYRKSQQGKNIVYFRKTPMVSLSWDSDKIEIPIPLLITR